MSKGMIAVDVDLTVVEMAVPWLAWLNNVCGCNMTFGQIEKVYGEVPYNLSLPFEPYLEKLHTDGMDFWRNEYLYDDKHPIMDSVKVLSTLHDSGYDVCFVSAITGNHQSSKFHFLKRYFPFLKGVVLTREKFLVDCDYLIDDRLNVLNAMPEKTTRIQYRSIFAQSEEARAGTHGLYCWRYLPRLLDNLKEDQ